MRVLVIEDDDSLRTALRRALVLGGFEVELAADGKEGLEMAQSGLGDVIVLDLGLPLLDGTEI
ncbi:MAG TPA: response regulator, partial [Solirubrobacteraceae bacterium]|nr:response regulator [Solirubrobacteraceae bacterium]